MAELKYHQAVVNLLGIQPEVIPSRIAMIEQREAACATRFPASVREWFSIESAEVLFHKNTNQDHLEDLTSLGNPQETAQGFLRVAIENQGVVAWYLRLSDGDDPAVFDNNDEWHEDLSKTSWRPYSRTFTNFIFDMIASHRFGGWYSGTRLSAIDQQPSTDELQDLGSRFQKGPVTDDPESQVYRFFTPAGLITILSNTPELHAAGKAEWSIETSSQDELFEFGKCVWHFGTLSSTLAGMSGTRESRAIGDQVIQRLREWAVG
jgi:hypothetical protein